MAARKKMAKKKATRKKVAVKKVARKKGTATQQATRSKGGKVVKDQLDTASVGEATSDGPFAYVTVDLAQTINAGDYESVKLRAGLTLPVAGVHAENMDDLDGAFERVHEWVSRHHQGMVDTVESQIQAAAEQDAPDDDEEEEAAEEEEDDEGEEEEEYEEDDGEEEEEYEDDEEEEEYDEDED